jgi:hypothetical protein
MPKLTCLCGSTHNLTPMPDDGWRTVRDRDWETLIDTHFWPSLTETAKSLLG